MLLLIDNYDSFTYNLLHYLQQLGEVVEVQRNDALTVDAILSRTDINGVVLSPGPCDPDKAGICLDLITRSSGTLPLLGVCLGHQAIGQAFGGKIIRAGEPVHGKVHPVYHNQRGIFKDIPSPFQATRYHSLIIAPETLPACLEITAWTEDKTIMGVQHKTLPIFGVQFHPESIASEHGHALLSNFIAIAHDKKPTKR